MSMNINSNQVSFFPSRIIRQGNTPSHRITATALQTWMQSLVDIDTKMFVVSYANNELVCYFDGVVVTIKNPVPSDFTASDLNLYVTAHFDSTGLWGDDSENGVNADGSIKYEFTGIELSSNAVTTTTNITSSGNSTTVYSLHALTKVGGSWQVPTESYHKFTSSSIATIDGGVV